MENPLLAYLVPIPPKPTTPELEQEQEQDFQRPEKADATYEEVIEKLYKLSISGLPRTKANINYSWKSRDEILNVLKTLEVLLSRRKKVLSDITRRAEDRIEPLSVRAKSQEDYYEQLKRENKEWDDKILAAKQRLADIKKEKEDSKKKHVSTLNELQSQIEAQGKRANIC